MSSVILLYLSINSNNLRQVSTKYTEVPQCQSELQIKVLVFYCLAQKQTLLCSYILYSVFTVMDLLIFSGD